MTLQEFKAWFEGFTENMKAAPTEKQWTRIKARVAEIDGVVITEKVFIDRYWPSLPYPHIYTTSPILPYTIWLTNPPITTGGVSTVCSNSDIKYSNTTAMYALGCAEHLTA